MAGLPAFRDEVLKGLESNLRKHNDLVARQTEALHEMHDTQIEMLKVLKDLKRLLTIKQAEPQQELLDVLRALRDKL